MKKVNISFSINSLDSKVAFTTEGELKNKRLKFVDPENNTNYIVFHNDVIEYYKKGSADMKFKFDTTKQTEGLYTASGHQFVFHIKTLSIKHESTELAIKYELYQDDELVNETTINIRYTVLKEE